MPERSNTFGYNSKGPIPSVCGGLVPLILWITTKLATDRAWLELRISPMSFLAQQGDMEDDQ